MHDLKLYESHYDISILVAAVYDPKEEENLSFKAIISLFTKSRVRLPLTWKRDVVARGWKG